MLVIWGLTWLAKLPKSFKEMKGLGPLVHIYSIEKNICHVIGISSFSLKSINCPLLFL
jgi:hypothetical protein